MADPHFLFLVTRDLSSELVPLFDRDPKVCKPTSPAAAVAGTQMAYGHYTLQLDYAVGEVH